MQYHSIPYNNIQYCYVLQVQVGIPLSRQQLAKTSLARCAQYFFSITLKYETQNCADSFDNSIMHCQALSVSLSRGERMKISLTPDQKPRALQR